MDLEDLGDEVARDVWLVGQELHSYDSVWDGYFDWDFSHMMTRLQKELESHQKESLFIFGSTEAQQFTLPSDESTSKSSTAAEEEGESPIKVLHIPVMVCVFSTHTLPARLGITSVQSSSERIVDMSELKMGWCPWQGIDSLTRRKRKRSDPLSRIHVLKCTQRNAGRGRYTREERRKEFEYALPYILKPKDVPEEPEEVTDVACEYMSKKGTKIQFGFDKEVDRTQIFIPEFIEDYSLDEDEFDPVKAVIKQAFVEKRALMQEQFDTAKASVDSLSEEQKVALDNIRVLKFYPRNDEVTKNMKTLFINRYFGKADEIC